MGMGSRPFTVGKEIRSVAREWKRGVYGEESACGRRGRGRRWESVSFDLSVPSLENSLEELRTPDL